MNDKYIKWVKIDIENRDTWPFFKMEILLYWVVDRKKKNSIYSLGYLSSFEEGSSKSGLWKRLHWKNDKDEIIATPPTHWRYLPDHPSGIAWIEE